MIFSHAWNEKRLRKQITGQRRKQNKSKFKRLLIIALILFGLFILYTNLSANKNNQSLSTYKPQASENIFHNSPALDTKQSNSSTHANTIESIPKVHRKEEKSKGNAKRNADQSPSFQTIASISTNEKNDKKTILYLELNSQDIETLEGLYKEGLNSSSQ